MTTETRRTVCPHDCPSACALSVALAGPDRIGAVAGVRDHSYVRGTICEKVTRYAERTHHPDRLTTPLLRDGPKGSGRFRPVSWDEALDAAATGLAAAAERHGPQAVWPYQYGGTMGLIQKGGLERLRHAMGWSGQHNTFCSAIIKAGWLAGVGRLIGPDIREMADAELIVIWGANPNSTQIQLKSFIRDARRDHDARVVVVDPYRTATAADADMHLAPRPGTDGALAAEGTVAEEILAGLMADPWFDAPPPKSLDRGAFAPALAAVAELGDADAAATLTAFTAATVARAAALMPAPPRRWLVTGGGRHNPVLMRMLSERLDLPAEPVEAAGWDGDALEAQAFAFLAVRSLLGLPLSLPETTGVPEPLSGGTLYPVPATV